MRVKRIVGSFEGERGEKLQKVLAAHGFGSRREMELWIKFGRVHVNGSVARLSVRVTPDEMIEVDGKVIHRSHFDLPRVIVMNKNSGMVVSRKLQRRQTSVFELLPDLHNMRWIAVGRLDIETSGLLIFTNSGELAHKLMHPSTRIDREYAVRINSVLTDEQMKHLKSGVFVDGVTMLFTDIQYCNGGRSNHWYHVVVMEGRNRAVRRLLESQGVRVSRLKRVRFGPVVLPSRIKRGHFAEISRDEVYAICELYNVSATVKRLPKTEKHLCNQNFLIPYPGLRLPYKIH